MRSLVARHIATRIKRPFATGGKMKHNLSTTASTTTLFQDLFNPTEEHAQLRRMLREFVKNEVEPQAQEYNRKEQFNLSLLQQLGDLGLLGLTVPEQYYGGSGMDATASVLVHEELSTSDPAFCLSYLAHSLLLVHNLSVNGNDAQKEAFLPKACSGEIIGGMAMSEPNAGTDVLGMMTKAVPKQDDGNDGDGNWILNGRKMWITNGTLDGGQTTGDLFLLYAKTGPERQDITTFLVEKNMPGFQLGQQIQDKLGMRASPTAELVLDNVSLTGSKNIVGTVNGATRCMMRNLEIERLGLAAMGLGIARRSINVMKEYASQRQAFGSDLYQFGQIQQMISTSYAEYMAGRTYVYALANRLDLHSDNGNNGLDADGTKLYCAQMAKRVADRAIQVLGGYGYVGDYVVERLWRDAKLLEIGGGTNQSHHKNMARDLKAMLPQELE